MSTGTALPIPMRILIGTGIGLLCGAVVFAGYSGDDLGAADWDQVWIAARAVLGGHDPYAAVAASRQPWPLLYPMPAVVLAIPFAPLPLPLARATWFAVASGVLAYAWSREPWRLTGFVSGAMWWAALGAQWTPLLLASVWLPIASVFHAVKPTSGLALFVHSPSRWAVYGAVVWAALSFALDPDWVLSWREAVRAGHQIPAIVRPGGVILLAALLRWRTPEGRLLAALAIIPHGAMPYDLLLLYATARRKVEWFLITVLSYGVIGFAFTVEQGVQSRPAVFATELWPAMLLLGYLPALIMVLRRPNSAEPDEAESLPRKAA